MSKTIFFDLDGTLIASEQLLAVYDQQYDKNYDFIIYYNETNGVIEKPELKVYAKYKVWVEQNKPLFQFIQENIPYDERYILTAGNSLWVDILYDDVLSKLLPRENIFYLEKWRYNELPWQKDIQIMFVDNCDIDPYFENWTNKKLKFIGLERVSLFKVDDFMGKNETSDSVLEQIKKHL